MAIGKKVKGITIEFDGDVSKLDSALKQINTAAKGVDTRLREISKSLKFNPGNAELIAQKQKALADKIDQTKKSLDLLKKADEAAKKQLESGELGQDDYNDLRREIIETESKLKHFQQQLKETNNYKLDKLSKQFTDAGEKISKAGEKIAGVGSRLSVAITAPLTALGAKGFTIAAELEDALGASEQIFKSASDEMEDWAGNLQTYYGISEGEALGYTNAMGAMLKNIGGLTDEAAAEQSQKLTELAGDLSAMFGGTTESAVQALTGALKGNNSMLDNYGMGINEATIKSKAFEMGLIAEGDQLSLASKQAATLALIMEQTADAQGQAAREADGASGTMKTLSTEVKNLATEVGQTLTPTLLPLVQRLKELVQQFNQLDPQLKQNIVKWGTIVAVIGPVLLVLGKIVSVVGLLTGGIGKAIGVFGKVQAALVGTSGAGGILSTKLLAITGGVGALVGAFAYLLTTNEEFRTKITEIWTNITETIGEFIQGLQERFSGLGEAVSNIANVILAAWDLLANTLAPVFEGTFSMVQTVLQVATDTILGILDIFIGIFTGNWQQAWDGIKNIVTTILNGIKNTIQTILNTITGLFTSIFNGIRTTVTNVWNGISGATSNIWNGIKSTVSNVVGGISSTISNLFNGIRSTVGNVWNGIKTAITTPINAARDIIGGAIDAIKGFFNFKFKWPKIPLPHFNISGSLNPLDWFSKGLPSIGIEWYAKGGIFDSPAIIGVGERGSEAVVPTDKLDSFFDAALKRIGASKQPGGETYDALLKVEHLEVRNDSDIDKIISAVEEALRRRERGFSGA